jgi:6-phosphogluconate dehydrogenase
MQLICEAYWLLKHGAGLSNHELAQVFAEWNRGDLDSYLIEITRDIFTAKDPDTGGYLVDLILDKAGAKGTGKWMSQLALDLGVPSTLVTEAVYARCLSALKSERVRASGVLKGPDLASHDRPAEFIDQVRQALYASKIAS